MTNQPELKACPEFDIWWRENWSKQKYTANFTDINRIAFMAGMNTSPSPIIPEDAVTREDTDCFGKQLRSSSTSFHWQFIQTHALEEQYHRWISGADLDAPVTDDALREAINETIKDISIMRGRPEFNDTADRLQTLINHAIKGQSK